MSEKIKYLIVLILILFTSPRSMPLYAIESLNSWYRIHNNIVELNIKPAILACIASDARPIGRKDSLYTIAISTAKYNGNDKISAVVYAKFFDDDDIVYNSNSLLRSKDFITIAERSKDNRWLYRAYEGLSRILISEGKLEDALTAANKAYYYITMTDDALLKIKCLLSVGSILEKNNNNIDAFRKYCSASYLALQFNDNRLLYECDEQLFSFYWLINDFDNAKNYKLKEIKLLYEKFAADSGQIMTENIALANLLLENNELEQGTEMINFGLNYAYRHSDNELKRLAHKIYRKHLIAHDDFKRLYQLYTVSYPDELKGLAAADNISYLWIKAFMCEGNQQPDSAALYYLRAESHINNSNPAFLSNFYNRYGKFLLRNGNVKLAKDKLVIAFKYARQAKYFPYLVETTAFLDSINKMQGNLREAYKYQKLNALYADSMAAVNRQGELFKLEIDNEKQQEDLVVQQENARIEQRNSLQQIAILFFIAAIFVILIMAGSFKVHKMVIQSIGYISFILLFEFIIMLTDKKVEVYTQGEPWKLLLFKLIIVAAIAPLHHYLEHGVVHYLQEHRLIDTSRFNLKNLFKRKPPAHSVPVAAKDKA